MKSNQVPKYEIGQLIKAQDQYQGLIIGVVAGFEWDTKISDWNMKCGSGYEDESENEDMWLYKINALEHRKFVRVFEDDIDGVIEVRGHNA